MNYQDTLDYMYSQLPMFHRIGAPAYKANLDNTIALAKLTDNPHDSFMSIHVAGTNGKGSVSNMLASVMQESGMKTGLFTSPHLVDFRERIRINGVMIDENYVVNFIEKYKHDFERIQPSFFEMTFALAMCWFAENRVDMAIIETGMGGRLDSTNVITPLISVITNIGYDHMQFLGNNLPDIASEKAGIIKRGIPVVIGESDPETQFVFINKANECDSELIFADRQVNLRNINNAGDGFVTYEYTNNGDKYIIESPLGGDYQLKNLSTVLAVLNVLEKRLGRELPIIEGLRKTVKNTGFRGRWEVLKTNPLTVCDIGHNTHGIKYIVDQINKQEFRKLHIVLGVVSDKDITSMLKLLPEDAEYYFCKADIPRGLDAGELRKVANGLGLEGGEYSSVAEAYSAARRQASDDDMIFIGGSAFVVAEVLS